MSDVMGNPQLFLCAFARQTVMFLAFLTDQTGRASREIDRLVFLSLCNVWRSRCLSSFFLLIFRWGI